MCVSMDRRQEVGEGADDDATNHRDDSWYQVVGTSDEVGDPPDQPRGKTENAECRQSESAQNAANCITRERTVLPPVLALAAELARCALGQIFPSRSGSQHKRSLPCLDYTRNSAAPLSARGPCCLVNVSDMSRYYHEPRHIPIPPPLQPIFRLSVVQDVLGLLNVRVDPPYTSPRPAEVEYWGRIWPLRDARVGVRSFVCITELSQTRGGRLGVRLDAPARGDYVLDDVAVTRRDQYRFAIDVPSYEADDLAALRRNISVIDDDVFERLYADCDVNLLERGSPWPELSEGDGLG